RPEQPLCAAHPIPARRPRRGHRPRLSVRPRTADDRAGDRTVPVGGSRHKRPVRSRHLLRPLFQGVRACRGALPGGTGGARSAHPPPRAPPPLHGAHGGRAAPGARGHTGSRHADRVPLRRGNPARPDRQGAGRHLPDPAPAVLRRRRRALGAGGASRSRLLTAVDPALHRRFYELEDWYWWSVGTRAIFHEWLAPLLRVSGARVLDVGCGSGAFAAELRDAASVTGVDLALEAILLGRERGLRYLSVG